MDIKTIIKGTKFTFCKCSEEKCTDSHESDLHAILKQKFWYNQEAYISTINSCYPHLTERQRISVSTSFPHFYAIRLDHFKIERNKVDSNRDTWLLCKVGMTMQTERNMRANQVKTLIKNSLNLNDTDYNNELKLIFNISRDTLSINNITLIETDIREKVGLKLNKKLAKTLGLPVVTEWILASSSTINSIKQIDFEFIETELETLETLRKNKNNSPTNSHDNLKLKLSPLLKEISLGDKIDLSSTDLQTVIGNYVQIIETANRINLKLVTTDRVKCTQSNFPEQGISISYLLNDKKLILEAYCYLDEIREKKEIMKILDTKRVCEDKTIKETKTKVEKIFTSISKTHKYKSDWSIGQELKAPQGAHSDLNSSIDLLNQFTNIYNEINAKNKNIDDFIQNETNKTSKDFVELMNWYSQKTESFLILPAFIIQMEVLDSKKPAGKKAAGAKKPASKKAAGAK